MIHTEHREGKLVTGRLVDVVVFVTRIVVEGCQGVLMSAAKPKVLVVAVKREIANDHCCNHVADQATDKPFHSLVGADFDQLVLAECFTRKVGKNVVVRNLGLREEVPKTAIATNQMHGWRRGHVKNKGEDSRAHLVQLVANTHLFLEPHHECDKPDTE